MSLSHPVSLTYYPLVFGAAERYYNSTIALRSGLKSFGCREGVGSREPLEAVTVLLT